ncbi:HHK1, histidine kinase-group X protein [Hyaloscypha variabilis]
MDGGTVVVLGDEMLDPPPRLFERLRHIAGYSFDETRAPFHSSYDNWQVFGTKDNVHVPNHGNHAKTDSERNSPRPEGQNHIGYRKTVSESGSEASSSHDSQEDIIEPAAINVVARVSTHALREERAYHICKNLIKKVDPEGNHIIKPITIARLPSQQGDKGPIVVCIFANPGPNYLPRVIDYGPAWYKGRRAGDNEAEFQAFREEFIPKEQVPLQTFLDFAIGATECLEILHHGQRIVHGEIRGDAFHMNAETGGVRLINFGSGLRTFEHGLTSTGWSTLSKEIGAKTKLSYMSPEQTGRMPAEPDSRTDIYSLGILFWVMLTQQPAFDGETPMDIIQAVLGKRLPSVSSMRMDIPDVIGRIIQKMTAKIIGDRYHSASGLRYDLTEVRRLLGVGDSASLKHWQIATKDVSSFFILPNVMMGRSKEHDDVVKIIDKVAKRHIIGQRQDVGSISSGSSLSLELLEQAIGGDNSSEGDNTSSAEGLSNSMSGGLSVAELKTSYKSGSSQRRSGTDSQHNSMDSQDGLSRNNSVLKPWEKNTSLSMDSRSLADSMNSEGAQKSSTSSEGVGSLTSHRNSQKFRRKGRCEVVSISGAAGLGKSCLVQSVQVEARRRGYFASSKFDQAKKTPFGPVLKLLSSLFKQVFSESNTNTPFHHILKQFVRPAWPLLHRVLGLPEFLIGPMSTSQKLGHSSSLSQVYNKSLRSETKRRDSSPSSSHNSLYNLTLGAQSSQDFLRAGTATKSMRLMNTFLDVLRVFTQHKFICFCLDDLQFADEESLDLITQIVAARMKMIIIVTYRPDEVLPERIRGIIDPPQTEEYIKAAGVGITRITLKPLTEEDVVDYVAATLSRPKPDMIPLAAVIHSKSAGNPFYMREMLDTCHRKQCIYYDYRESRWCYDLDKVFKQFETSSYTDTLNHEFVKSRLNELPAPSRSILAWASLIGSSFSFDLVQRLLSGEFDYDDSTSDKQAGQPYSLSHSQQDVVEGLQTAIQAYVIVATEDDDRFRFAHDRYMQAASSLRECNGTKMHFIIAQTLMKYYSSEERSRSATAVHISECVDIISERVKHRQSFRKLLFDCATSAAETGARSTAAKYYTNCFALLQNNPWKDGEIDVYYDETLQLYTRAAECYLYMGLYTEAKRLLSSVFSNARTAVEKAPAWVLQSRIYAQEGDSQSAFRALKECLTGLGVEVDDEPTFEKCDAEFERLIIKIQSIDPNDLVTRSMAKDSNLAAVGAVLVETISAAFWSDRLTFYQMSLVMVNTQLTCGNFPQSGMAYLHLALIAITRFTMIKFAVEMGNLSLAITSRWRDPYTTGRGATTHALFIGHLSNNLHESVAQLEGAVEHAIQTGNRITTILTFGLLGNLKFFACDNFNDLESFLHFGIEEIEDWQLDTRGGALAIAVRQACRALQGKTFTKDPLGIMSDDSHNSEMYKTWLKNSLKISSRPLLFYEGMEVAPLFLYGHYQRAVELGSICLENIDNIWSARNNRFTIFMHGLSLAGITWAKLQNPLRGVQPEKDTGYTNVRFGPTENELLNNVAQVTAQVKELRKKIVDWQAFSDVNYLTWSELLAAQIHELEANHAGALVSYEKGLDHAAAHGFLFEEALGNYLLAGFFLRSGSRRAAKGALREALALWRTLGATGVAEHIEEEHSLLLQGPTRSERTADASAQTDFAGDSAPVQYTTLEGNEDEPQNRAIITETRGDRIGQWQGASARPDVGSGLPALDMLDLTSILESSQVISSVLQVDQLLKTMCEIILQNCGGLATSAAIVVEEDDPVGWSIAASGDSEKGAVAHIPGIPLNETALVAEGVILYCTRFRETVFLPDLIHDERFSNVSEAWANRNPVGKSVIAIPICHGGKPLLGVLYLEGEPNAFTDRNLTVLQLLVNQIGISYSNALTLKEVEKVSAFNNSMVDVQKKALAKALDAEKQANIAKAEALRSVKLAEEAAKAKSIFLANVSHELRTPLNGVIGNSELLRDSDLTKDQAEMADSIRVSADLLLTVINDILDFSKMEADKMELFIVAFKADEMMREVVRSVSYSNRDKKNVRNVEILQDINLPKSLIFGDPVRLHQVLGNLVSNSLKFTENGSITIGARTDWETSDQVKLTFWVKDTGIGIPPQQLVKLFKPFSQADASTARKYGGSGLGLSICKSLIESMMGGKIQLESAEGEGTTAWFTVTFPKAKEAIVGDIQNGVDQQDSIAKHARTERAHSNTPYSDFSHIPRDQLRICIAEDNPVNQKIAVQFMKKLGFKHVDAYENGQQAVEGLRKKARAGQPYHIVLMDVQMPVLDGYEATKLLRRDPIEAVRGTLVIAMTASAIQGDREKCLESGMNDYLAKPVRSNVLKKKLDQYIQQPFATPNLQAEAKKVANKILQEMNGTATPSDQNSSSGTATPTSPRESASSTTSPSPLSQPAQTADHNQEYGFGTNASAQTNIGRMPRHEEEVSPKSVPVRIRSKQMKSENEPLLLKEGGDRSKDVAKGSGADGHK